MLSKRILFLVLMCCSLSAFAKLHNVSVKLISVKAVKVAEKHGDEVYFSITQYPTNANPTISRVPMEPIHWKVAELSQVKDVVLWQGTVADEQSTLLILSLLEQDLPPWNPDEHIGSAELKINNKGGKFSTVWGQPEFKDQPEVKQSGTQTPTYTMYGNNSEYVVRLKVVVD